MPSKNIQNFMETSLENVSLLIDSSKIIGKPLIIDEHRAIIPIAKVSFGFGTGGSEFDSNKKGIKNELLFESGEEIFPFGGGSVGGVSLNPEAFLLIDGENTKIIYMEQNKSLFDQAFGLFKEAFKNRKKK